MAGGNPATKRVWRMMRRIERGLQQGQTPMLLSLCLLFWMGFCYPVSWFWTWLPGWLTYVARWSRHFFWSGWFEVKQEIKALLKHSPLILPLNEFYFFFDSFIFSINSFISKRSKTFTFGSKQALSIPIGTATSERKGNRCRTGKITKREDSEAEDTSKSRTCRSLCKAL